MAESDGGSSSSSSVTRLSSSSRSSRSRLGLLSQSEHLLNTRQGLLSQTEELFNNPTNNSRTNSVSGHGQSTTNSVQTRMGTTNSHPSEDSRTNSVSGLSQSTINSGQSVNQPSTSSAQGVLNQSSSTTSETVTDLRQTLTDVKLMLQFRLFLRTKIDRNKSGDPEYKKMAEQWLDFVTICEQVFELPEAEIDAKIHLMVEIGEKFLGKPPDSYNMALKNQLNRKELINHCINLSARVTSEPDDSLLRDGYEYVWGKLEQKHDVFRKTCRPTTKLAALMCVLS